MGRAYAGVKSINIFKKDDWANATGFLVQLGLRADGSLQVTDFNTPDHLNRTLNMGKIFHIMGDTYQIPFEALQTFIRQFATDSMVNASIASYPQSIDPSSGVGIPDIFTFGYTPNGNGYTGFDFDFTLDQKERKCKVDLEVKMSALDADAIITAAKTNTDTYGIGLDRSKVYPPQNVIIFGASPSDILMDKSILSDFKLELKNKGEKSAITNRTNTNFIEATLEFSGLAAKVDDFLNYLARANDQSITLEHDVALLIKEQFTFNGSITRTDEYFVGKDKRYIKATFKGDIPLLNVVPSVVNDISSGITTKQLIFN